MIRSTRKCCCGTCSWQGWSDLPVDVVVELVVAGQGGEASPAHGQREEDLGSSVPPHARLSQQLPPGRGVEADAVTAAAHADAANQQHQDGDVGNQHHDVGHLPQVTQGQVNTSITRMASGHRPHRVRSTLI